MKTKVITMMMTLMILASVSMYAGGFDYEGVWILDTVGGYMNMNNPKNRTYIIPSETSVIVKNEKGKALTYFGRVHIMDEDHIIVTDTDGKEIKLVREDYAIYARALALEKAKEIAKGVGEIAITTAFFFLLDKIVTVGIPALLAL